MSGLCDKNYLSEYIFFLIAGNYLGILRDEPSTSQGISETGVHVDATVLETVLGASIHDAPLLQLPDSPQLPALRPSTPVTGQVKQKQVRKSSTPQKQLTLVDEIQQTQLEVLRKESRKMDMEMENLQLQKKKLKLEIEEVEARSRSSNFSFDH